MTPEEARSALASVRPAAVMKAVKGALRAGAGRIKRRSVKDFLASGIGRGVYVRDAGGTGRTQAAKGKKNATKLLTVSRVETSGLTAKAVASVKGLAALAEIGGRIGPHTIQSKRPSRLPDKRPLLSFGSDGVASGPVAHPGANVRKNDSMQRALTAEDPKITADITKRIDEMVYELLVSRG